MSQWGVLFWVKCIWVLEGFALDKETSSLEPAMPIPIKARDPFLRIRKKIGPMLNLEVRRQTVLTIAEEEAPTPKKKASPSSPKKEGKKVLRRRVLLETTPKIQKAKENQPPLTKEGAKARYLCLRLPRIRGDCYFNLSWIRKGKGISFCDNFQTFKNSFVCASSSI